MVNIRPELPDDVGAVSALLRQAFDGTDEAALVERLRSDGDAIGALVAIEGDGVVGHILFSELGLQEARVKRRLAALAPLAVLPACQGRGIGSALVRDGLQACRRGGIAGVFVLGEPGYYARFGFSSEAATAVASPFAGPAFQALPLRPGAFDGLEGRLRYPSAFGLNDA